MPSHRSLAALPKILLLLVLPGQLITIAPPARAQTPTQTQTEVPWYARRNTFGVTFAYSPDSSHMLLGLAERRKLLQIGASYNRRLVLNRLVSWQYSGELLPVALVSDPLTRVVENQVTPAPSTVILDNQPPMISCAPVTTPYTIFLGDGTVFASGTETTSCHGRRWTIGQEFAPVGFQWNFLPHRRLQPFLNGHGGYIYSTEPIPVDFAGSFNFTFAFGAGVELYRSEHRSVRIEYRYHHISNHDTAPYNPGIDNGVIQVGYAFGR